MSHVHFLAEGTCQTTSANSRTDANTILLIDDYPELLQVAAQALAASGYRAVSFTRPSSALEYVSQNKDADLLICDVLLPQYSGLHLADEIRRRKPGIPVLYVTGSPSVFFELKAKYEGRTDITVLEKPFRIGELIGAVSKMLVNAGLRQRLKKRPSPQPDLLRRSNIQQNRLS